MELSKRFEKALQYATRAHAEQPRKGTSIPYIAHPLGVAGIALTYGADEDEAIAALLHDVIEDGGGAKVRKQIRAMFGPRVARIVDACSDTDVKPKPPWRERKEKYVAHLRSASRSARFVSAADKLDNARAILADYRVLGEKLWERFNGGRSGTLWYYRALVDEFRRTGETPLVAALREVVEEIERSAASSNPALTAGKALFTKAGFDWPPIPPELAARLEERRKWYFSTQEPSEWSPYAFGPFVKEGTSKRARDYVLLAHAGHGLNSWAIHYFLVRGPLRIFLQGFWGGIYHDEKETAEVNRCFALLAQLIPAVEAATRAGRFRADDRLVIVASDMGGCDWTKPGRKDREELEGKPADALTAVLRWVEGSNPEGRVVAGDRIKGD